MKPWRFLPGPVVVAENHPRAGHTTIHYSSRSVSLFVCLYSCALLPVWSDVPSINYCIRAERCPIYSALDNSLFTYCMSARSQYKRRCVKAERTFVLPPHCTSARDQLGEGDTAEFALLIMCIFCMNFHTCLYACFVNSVRYA